PEGTRSPSHLHLSLSSLLPMRISLRLAALCALPMWRLLPAHGIDRGWIVAAFLPAGLVVLLWIMALRGKEKA
ncbi:MAG: hypothetical protein AAGJ92_03860, partial [Pseudomonadota bacterium]